MSFYIGKDRYFYPIIITPNNNTVAFTEGGSSVITFDISTGVYWMHLDTTQAVNDLYPSLAFAVRDGLQNNSPNNQSYTVSAFDLSAGDLRYSTIEFDNGNISWKFKFSDGSHTLNPGYLGFPKFKDTDALTGAGSTAINGTVSVLGQWISPDNSAYKTRDKRKKVFRSDSGPNAVTNSWTPTSDVRKFKYWKVPGAFIYSFRARDSDIASDAGLPANDTNNAFEDMASALGDSRVLARYGVSDQSNAMEFNTESPSVSESWTAPGNEINLMSFLSSREKWEGEHYDLTWDGIIYENEPQLNGYDH